MLGQYNMYAVVAAILALVGMAGAQSPPCVDADTQGCQNNPSMCQDPDLAAMICPKTCNVCPFYCYHCDSSVSQYNLCNQTTICNHGQACMIRHKVSVFDGSEDFTMKCVDRKVCDSRRRDVTTHCCQTDKCNYPDPPTTSTSSTTASTTTTTTTTTTPPTTSSTTTTTLAPTSRRTTTHATQTAYHVHQNNNPYAGCRKDITIILDESPGMQGDAAVKQFLIDLIAPLTISPFVNRVAMLTTNPLHAVGFTLNTYRTKHELEQVFRGMQRSAINFISDSMVGVQAYNEVASRLVHGNRFNVRDVVLILTASNWHPEYETLSAHSIQYNLNLLHYMADKVIPVGVGTSIIENQLKRLAKDQWVHVRTSSELHRLKNQLLNIICS